MSVLRSHPLATASAVLLAGWLAWHSMNGPRAPRGAGARQIPVAAVSESPFLNTRPGVAYVGSDRCVVCHAEQHDSYLKTFHSRSMARVQPGSQPPDAVFDHEDSARRYSVRSEDGKLWHAEWMEREREYIELQSHAMVHRVGSGHFGSSYLTEDGGFLVQSPITWYAPRHEWDMSPGYDRPWQASFQRTVSTGCLFCHVGRFDAVDSNPHQPIVHELAIGCERCHGPGERHVDRWTGSTLAAAAGVDHTIVHPSRLSRRLSEAICAQCHLQSDVRVAVRGRTREEFRPGLPLEDFEYEFRMQSSGEEMTIVGHVDQLHASRCYQESETLTCTTCHDPHRPLAPEERDVAHRQVCVTCHQPDSCGLDVATREQRGSDRCVQCHMPEADTEVAHVAFTHHRIGLHPDREVIEADAEAALVSVQDLSRLSSVERDRVLGLAYWYYYKHHANDPLWSWCAGSASRLLGGAVQAGLRDPVVDWALAEIASNEGRTHAAVQLAEQVLAAEPQPTDERTEALRLVALDHFREHRFAQARGPLEELIRVRRNATDWFYFGLCVHSLGRSDQAIEALERSLEIEPAQAGSHAALAAIYTSLGDSRLAEVHRAQAEWLAQQDTRRRQAGTAAR